jgi:hypothetical protein
MCFIDQVQKAAGAPSVQGAGWALDCPHLLGTSRVMPREKLLLSTVRDGGYDLVTPAMNETPDFPQVALYGQKDHRNIAKTLDWLASVLLQMHRRHLLKRSTPNLRIPDVGRRFFRMRDERGLANGFVRRWIVPSGPARKATLWTQASSTVVTPLCRHSQRSHRASWRLGFAWRREGCACLLWSIPTPRELERRHEYIAASDPHLILRARTPPPPILNPMIYLPATAGTVCATYTLGMLFPFFAL